MKICSFNTLQYKLSSGQSSNRDQLKAIQEMIRIENPDVAILLEMPNPRATVDSSNLAIMQHLHMFEQWLSNVAGYRFQRKIDDDLCVWVVSKKLLIPLLFLGSETISGAASRIFKIPASEVFAKKVTAGSDYLDCLASVMCAQARTEEDERRAAQSHPAFGWNPKCGKDRSIVVGVVDDEVYKKSENSAIQYRRVLPLIATHAKCLFQNDRFGRVLSTLCRAAVVKKGVVVGDFNFGMESNKEDRKIEESDERLNTELEPGVLDRFVKLPLGQSNKEPPFATCNQISFPYAPLNIDGVFSSKALDIKVGAHESVYNDNRNNQPDEKSFTEACVSPCEEFPSDHRWITFTADTDTMIEVPVRKNSAAAGARQQIMDDMLGHGDFVDSRFVCYQWTQSHPELFALFDKPITLMRPPLPAVEGEDDGVSVKSASSSQQQQGQVAGGMKPPSPTGVAAASARTGRNRSPPVSSTRTRSPTNTRSQSSPLTTTRTQQTGSALSASPLSPGSPSIVSNLCTLDNTGDCPLGSENCPNIHKTCKFGDRCRRPVCHFGHPKKQQGAVETVTSGRPPIVNNTGLNLNDDDGNNNSKSPPSMGSREGTKRPAY